MDTPLFRPEPPDAESLWRVEPGQRITVHPRNVLVVLYLLVPVGLSAMLGTITFNDPTGHAITSFWPAAAFQVVLPIWFGVFGTIPCVLGPMLGNALITGSASVFFFGNVIQSTLAGVWFRRRRLDPRLVRGRDWAGLMLIGCLLGNALGALAGITECYVRHQLAGESYPLAFYARLFPRWFLGNALPCIVLAPALLKAGSQMIVRGPVFCERFFGAVDRGPQEHMRFGNWNDVPIYGKLMILVLAAGLLPLYAVGAVLVVGTLYRADTMASLVNQRAAYDDRTGLERHAEMLKFWARAYARAPTQAERRDLLEQWRDRRFAFDDLQAMPSALIEPEMPARLWQWYQKYGIVFYVVPDPQNPDEQKVRGVVRLSSPPDEVLAGYVEWRVEPSLIGRLRSVEGYLVMDPAGHVLYSRGPPALAGWRPPEERFEGEPKIVNHGGQAWHVAEAFSNDLNLRIITISPVRAARAKTLANMPNFVSVIINLAIFGCLIVGQAIARRLGQRVLEMAERIREAGPALGELHIPVRGRDELGYLAETLNRVSLDLERYVRELQQTTAEKERLAGEMELARQVQQSVLPAKPLEVPGYELAGRCLPALEVGGDFFDMFPAPDGSITLMIGDAVGKGLAAAMLTTETHGIARAGALDSLTPDRILNLTNTAMLSQANAPGRFVTMFCARLDGNRHVLEYSGAGHNPPLWLRDAESQELRSQGFPLAISSEGSYALERIVLNVGDVLVLYTDGVTEAVNNKRELFNTERLRDVVRRHAHASAEHLVEAVLNEVRHFTEGAPQSDDITLLVVRRSR